MPNSVLTRRRSLVARIAVLAMVASLMVIGAAAPASAAISTTSSCPNTIPDAGFTDIGSYDATTQRAINCLASYGIAQGTSATTYNPAGTVKRWQMALFLTRQATDHGVTLPSGAPQGFTDITSLPASTQVAINQLAQLEITTGTSATTFSPMDDVPRWQMALFITRLVDAAGVTLPSGAPQGFTDLGGLSNAAMTAINQLNQLGIADGTSATTFAPFMDVNRWQMALFLTRTLAADGITPSGLAEVTVSPSTDASLSNGTARAYEATFVNDDGTPYTGKVGLFLSEVDTDDTPAYGDDASDAGFTIVEGVSMASTDTWNGFPGLDGKVSFVVRHGGGVKEEAVPLAWKDLNGDNDPDYATGTDKPPTEPYGLGGIVTFSAAAAAEAVDGDHTGVVVSSVNASGNSFVGDDAAHAPETFNYDDADIFLIEGSLSDITGFEAALSETDVVDVDSYDASEEPGATNTTTYNIVTDNTATSTLKVTAPSSAVSIDANNYVVQGTGQVGYIVSAHIDAGDDLAIGGGDTKVAEATVAADGSWSLSVPLQQGVANNFVVSQRASSGAAVPTPGVNVPTITEGAPAAAKLAASTWTDAVPNGSLNVDDVLTLNFNESVDAPDNGDTVELIDSDGTRARLTCGSNATCVAADADTITVTVTLFPEIVVVGGTSGLASPAQIEVLGGFVGTDGLAVNVAGSGANRLLTEA